MIRRLQFGRQEKLVDHLIDLLEQPPGPAWLVPQQVVVPSMDMANWLQVAMARQSAQQIAANIDYYQPVEFIDYWSEQLIESDEEAEWTKSNMQWALFQLLPELDNVRGLEKMPAVRSDARREQLKRYRLAGHLADTFDKYMIYRPDWLWRWRNQKPRPDEVPLPDNYAWQALLWHRLCKTYSGFTDRAARSMRALRYMEGQDRVNQLPPRILLVQLPSLPRTAVSWFNVLGSLENVNLQVLEWRPLNPLKSVSSEPKESGGKQLGRRRIIHLREQWNEQRRDYLELARKWSEAKREKTSGESVDHEATSNLSLLQKALFQPEILDDSEAAFDPTENRASLQIHAAHGPRREVEVLYEKLLECFDRDATLQPDDILIVSPDMETYAPHINAVFDEPGDDELRIPYHRFDAGGPSRKRLSELLIELLEVARGRFKVTGIIDLLAHPVIRASINMDLEDVELLEEQLIELNVRWGYDAGHREKMLRAQAEGTYQADGKISEQNSWQGALDRLWLGLSTRVEDEQLIHDRLPYGAVEGSDDGRRIGGLQRLIHQLWQLHQFTQTPHTLGQWKTEFLQLVRNWLVVEREQEPDVRWLLEHLTGLDDFEEQINSEDSPQIAVDVMLEMLEQHLLQQRHPVTRMAGRAAVSPMIPVRGVPFKVIALVGLNQDNFPGSEPANPFDATQEVPRPGDRSRRREDRQLMLDYLLSARENLLITYNGRDQRDDESRPPSPLVTELLNLLTAGEEDLHEQWITSHPLHGFEGRSNNQHSYLSSRVRQSSEAFEGDRQEEKQMAPLARINASIDWKRWLPDQQPVVISLRSLVRFYKHPIRYYCEQNLGLRLREEDQLDTDEEPFELSGLTRYQLYEVILNAMLQDPGWEPDFHVYEEKGVLPHGILGRSVWREAQVELQQQRDQIWGHLHPREVNNSIKLDLGLSVDDHAIQLRGESGLLAGDLQLLVKTGGSVKPKDRLRTWIKHLVLQADGQEVETCLWGKESKKKSFTIHEQFKTLPKDQASDYLLLLIRGMLIGTCRPLAFLPKSGYAWASEFFKEDGREADRHGSPLSKAEDAYYDETAYRSYENENDDPYYQYFFHDLNPYAYPSMPDKDGEREETEKLIETAEKIWAPVWEVGR